jgi:hypothetical protein
MVCKSGRAAKARMTQSQARFDEFDFPLME